MYLFIALMSGTFGLPPGAVPGYELLGTLIACVLRVSKLQV